MNLSPAESAGSSTLSEALAAPPAASEPAPAAESFRSLLREADAEENSPGLSNETSAPAAAEPQAASDAAEEATEPPPPTDEDPVSTSDKSMEQAVAIAVPIAPFQPLPSIADTEEATADAASVNDLTAAGSIEAAKLVLQGSPTTVSVEAGNGEDAAESPEQLPPDSPAPLVAENAQPIDLHVATQDSVDAPPAVEAAEPSSGEPADDQPDHEGREHQPSAERQPPADGAVDVSAAKAESAAAVSLTADLVVPRTDQPTIADRLPPATAGVNLPPAPSPAPVLPPELATPHDRRNQADGQVASADNVRLLTRVARAFHSAQDGGEVRIRLSPPELGALRMEVRVLEGALVARLETETAAARTAIIENLPALRERLAEQGVRIERFDVDLMQRHAGGSPDRPTDRQPPEHLPPPPALRPRRMPQVAEGVVARHAIAADAGAGRLNVIV
jgi:flagellar hook-length control protein FliK